MDKKDYKTLKQEVGEQWRFLGALYSEENQTLSEDEAACLNPILHTLREGGRHYSEPEFVCAGGEKKIFKVRDLLTDRVVAMAKPVAAATDLERERFLREARLMANLQHPNILSVYEQGLDEAGDPYFTMEFIPGDDLRQIVKTLESNGSDESDGHSQARLLEIFVKICDGVAYAHSRGVVHLDIKPANIQVGAFGEALLCDWGLARVISAGFDDEKFCEENPLEDLPNSDLQNDLTPSGFIKGTPGFMAPEQAGRGGPVDERTDVYSLGALLYYLLVHRAPVSGASSQEILEKTVAGELDPPGRYIPRGLQAVMKKALSRNPTDRYQSAVELRDELERYTMGFATDAQQAGALDLLVLLIRRRPTVFRVVAAASGIIVLLLALAFARVVHEKQVAENNLRLYIEETEHSAMLTDSISGAVTTMQKQNNYLEAAGKIRLLSIELELTEDDQERQALIKQLAMLHFVIQDFNSAGNYFGQMESPDRQDLFFKQACLGPAKLKQMDSDWLAPEELRELILSIPREWNMVGYSMAFYYYRSRKDAAPDPERALPLVETLLDLINGMGRNEAAETTLRLEHRDEGLVLSLRGKPYVTFHLPLPGLKRHTNALGLLDLYSLDISGGKLTNPAPLAGSNIKELNMAGISDWNRNQIYSLQPLHLKRVYHSLDQPDDFLKRAVPNTEFIRVDE